MNTEGFTSKVHAFDAARPGYPDKAIDYISSLVPLDAVFTDVGVRTGKFTKLITRCGYKIFEAEPNTDMREQLVAALAPFPTRRLPLC